MKKLIVLSVLLLIASGLFAQNVGNFSFKDIENRKQSFEELKGEKLTLIDFWATWCKPCIKSIPELNKIFGEYKDKGVNMIGINCDGPRSTAKAGPFSRSLRIEYPVLIDIESELLSEFNLMGLPSMVLVDSRGEILWVHQGFVKGDETIIREEIEKALLR